MSNTVYKINKGINRSIEFKGLRGQYIWYFAGGAVFLLVLFAVLYIVGVNTYLCMVVILGSGAFLVWKVFGMSRKYGEYGLMKAMARRRVPKMVKIYSRKVFTTLKTRRR